MSTEAHSTQLLADITIGVVGAGPAGLSLALALKHLGFPSVTVFEARPQPLTVASEHDQLLELTANGSRVLHALGLQSALAEQALCPGFAYLRTRRNGFLLTQRPLGDFSEARYGAPSYLVRYSQLCSLLSDACTERGVHIRTGVSVSDVTPESGLLELSDHPDVSFSAVIIADGGDGRLHTRIGAKPIDALSTDIRTLYARASHQSDAKAVYSWLDDRSYCLQYPNADDSTDLLLVLQADHETFASSRPRELMEQWTKGAHGQLRSAGEAIDSVIELNAPTVPMAEHWHAGRTAMLGDAVHLLPRHETQGINTALEDAWVLAIMMERWEEAPQQGFSDYQRFRQARMRKLYRESARATGDLLLSSSSEQFRRNFKWSVVNRFLPEVSMAQWDWLYGYNCIKGFV